MDAFWAVIANMSAVATLSAEVRNVIDMASEQRVNRQLEQLYSGISFSELPVDLEIYAMNIESYIAKKKGQILADSLFSPKERSCFTSEFFRKYPYCLAYKKDITPILQKFLDRLEQLLLPKLSLGEKFIIAGQAQLRDQLSEISEKLQTPKSMISVHTANKLYTDSFSEVLFLHRHKSCSKVTLNNLFITPKCIDKSNDGGTTNDNDLVSRLATSVSVKSFPFVFIEGDAGCGKSTFVAWLNYQYAHNHSTAYYILGGRPLVTIRLRDLNKESITREKSLLPAILQYMNLTNADELERYYPGAVMMLDGFDELCMIEGISDYEELIYDLHRRHLANFMYIITTRPKYIRVGSINVPHAYMVLSHFDADQRRKWLYKYTNPQYCGEVVDGHVKEYIESIDDDSSSGICDTPMALYMLAAKQINLTTLQNTWALFHQIFYEELSNGEYNKMFPEPNHNYAHRIIRHRNVIYRISEEIAYQMYCTRNNKLYLSDYELRKIIQKLSVDIPDLQYAQLQTVTERCYALCNYWKADASHGVIEFYHNNIRDFFLCEKIFREMNSIYEEWKCNPNQDVYTVISRLCQLFRYGILEKNVIEFLYYRCLLLKDFPAQEHIHPRLPEIFEVMLTNGQVFEEVCGSNPFQNIINVLTCTAQIYRYAYEPFLFEGNTIKWWNSMQAIEKNGMLSYVFRQIYCQVPITINHESMISMASRCDFSGLDLQGGI